LTLLSISKLAFAVEISLARKDNSEIMIKNKEELLHALTDKETFRKILDQGAEAHEVSEYIKDYLRESWSFIIDYFMKIKDKVNAEELRFY
jgi:aminoglycoside/choline kinase family phosphotransferase